MKAVKRTILFTQHKAGGKTVTRPVAVFPNPKVATAFKSLLSVAHASGVVADVQSLDPEVPLDETGKLHAGTKFAILEVPYAPGPETAETTGDTFEM